jgi:hypothetical protein
MSLTFVQGDTAPDITAIIHEEDDISSVIDLSSGLVSGVRFQMRRSDDRRYQVNSAATVVDGPTGRVSYSWGPNDLSVPGTYVVQWEVTYQGGRVQTTSPEVTVTVRRQ